MIEKIKAFLANPNFRKWVKNSLVFAAPAGIIFLTAIQSGIPVKDALYSVYLWMLNIAIDALKKIVSNSTEA